MPSTLHETSFQPKSPDTLVWRYMDLPKFISLLDTKKLYLTRADMLNDTHEGSINSSSMQSLYDKNLVKYQDNMLKSYSLFQYILRKSTFISSWHINNHESYAMWKLYCGTTQGVAIQTTYKKLLNSFYDKNIYIGKVKYLKYSPENISDKFIYEYFMYKRKFFEYEREVRILKNISHDLNFEAEIPEGLLVDVNLKSLIQHIYVNPYSPEWYYSVIKSILNKYQPDLISNLTWSSIRGHPLF